jgi:hypothetical protein
MHLPSERQVVNGVGLGELEGFKLKKAFKRLVKVKKSSFKLKNIMGAVGSATMFTGTMGLSSVVAPKLTGAHSKLSRIVGIGATAIAAGAGAIALAPAGTMAAIGSGVSSIGGGLMTGLKAVGGLVPMAGKLVGGIFGGGGTGVAPQQQYTEQPMYGPVYDPAAMQYAQQVEAQRAQMYTPGMVQDVTYRGEPLEPITASNSYGDLRSPYTAQAEDGRTLQIDPATGEIVQPIWTNPVYLGGGAVVLLLGLYMMQGNDKK